MSQKSTLLAHLKRGKSITSLEFLKLAKSMTLAERVRDLKEDGYRIKTTMLTLRNGKRVGRYSLVK